MACCNGCAKTSLVNRIKNLLLNINGQKKWMQKAVKHPGSFTAYAKANGGMGADGKIDHAWASKLAEDKSISMAIRRKAQLYLTFMRSK